MTLAPIVLFVYNRPDHTQKTLEALRQNILASESHLYIFSDGPKDDRDVKPVHKVRSLIQTITGFKEIHLFEEHANKGLAASVIDGVTKILSAHDRVIVLEDDIVTAPSFLSFCNESLSFYKEKKDVFSISGYSFPIEIPENYTDSIYVSSRASSWGWCTWADRWKLNDWQVSDFDSFIHNPKAVHAFNEGGVDLSKMLQRQMNGVINSWAIRWCYTHFKNNAVCLYPVTSLVENIGNDNSGTHSPGISKYTSTKKTVSQAITFHYPVLKNNVITHRLKMFFKIKWKDRFEYIIRKILNR